MPAAPLIARWQAMLDTMKHHKRRAKRLARTIQRWQAAGEARPHVPPIPRSQRMSAALGLVSGGLTVKLIEALKSWPDPLQTPSQGTFLWVNLVRYGMWPGCFDDGVTSSEI